MIYLIDDNQNKQRENLGIDFVNDETFAEVLTSVEKIEKRGLTELSHLDFLNDAACILLHQSTEDYDFEANSFISGSRTNVIKIVESIAQEGDVVSLALFSNGMSETVYNYKITPNFVQQINKNLFYSHLYDFVDYYKQSGKIEMRILAWGKNFQSKEVSELAGNLLGKLAYINGSDIFEIKSVADEQNSLLQFIELSLVKDNAADVLRNLEEDPLTVNEFRDKLNRITESFLKYGKNIYPWK